MSTVFALYTGHGLMEPLSRMFAEELPNERLVNVVDDSIIRDMRDAGGMSSRIAARILDYYRIAERMGADMIFNTCSSVGDVADRAGFFMTIPVIRIDRAMAALAVRKGSAVGVVATLDTTLDPTIRLVENEASLAGKSVTVVPVLASGAYDALVSGKTEDHDRLIREAAQNVSNEVDVFVLAQGSMARMEVALGEATGKPVLSSIRLGIRSVADALADIAKTR